MSAKDVETMRSIFDGTVKNMTEAGVRTAPPLWNNISSFGFRISAGLVGHDYRGCGDQADQVQAVFEGLHGRLDDDWTFEGKFRPLPLPHRWFEGTSSNPADPPVVVDPWSNEFQPGPVPPPSPEPSGLPTPPRPTPVPPAAPLDPSRPLGETGIIDGGEGSQGSNVDRYADTKAEHQCGKCRCGKTHKGVCAACGEPWPPGGHWHGRDADNRCVVKE